MSVEDFKKFGQMCAEDEEIREKVKEIGLDNIEGWIKYSKNELGLEFDLDDIQALANETLPVDELNDEQLEQVAGGFLTVTAASAVVAAVGAGAAVAGAAVRLEALLPAAWQQQRQLRIT